VGSKGYLQNTFSITLNRPVQIKEKVPRQQGGNVKGRYFGEFTENGMIFGVISRTISNV
jgi:hypothetical protein